MYKSPPRKKPIHILLSKQLLWLLEGIITNVGMAHMKGFGSPNGVIKAKMELYSFINQDKLRAISSSKFLIFEIRIPASGTISYSVIVGPMVARTSSIVQYNNMIAKIAGVLCEVYENGGGSYLQAGNAFSLHASATWNTSIVCCCASISVLVKLELITSWVSVSC